VGLGILSAFDITGNLAEHFFKPKTSVILFVFVTDAHKRRIAALFCTCSGYAHAQDLSDKNALEKKLEEVNFFEPLSQEDPKKAFQAAIKDFLARDIYHTLIDFEIVFEQARRIKKEEHTMLLVESALLIDAKT
jgi:hypothetical protein